MTIPLAHDQVWAFSFILPPLLFSSSFPQSARPRSSVSLLRASHLGISLPFSRCWLRSLFINQFDFSSIWVCWFKSFVITTKEKRRTRRTEVVSGFSICVGDSASTRNTVLERARLFAPPPASRRAYRAAKRRRSTSNPVAGEKIRW